MSRRSGDEEGVAELVPAVDAGAIALAVEALRRGGLVALPTETVYGLAADAGNEAALRRIFAAKGRPADHPVIVHVVNANALAEWAEPVPAGARRLAAAFWPGPLTLVLRRRPQVSALITGGQDTLGLRAPAHPWAQALLRAFGGGVAAPSANRFGRISPTTAQHVIDELGVQPAGAVDVVLDGGPCPVGIESTIVDLSGVRPRLLRPGAITRDQIESVLGETLQDADAAAPRASGGLEKHYAPRTRLDVVALAELPGRVLALSPQPVAVLAPGAAPPAANLRLHLAAPNDPVAYARSLYDHLRRLDASGAARLLVARPPAGPAWEAIHDRLKRASAGSAT
jgi:L-threonylcarbamoyladenylate synthase